MTYPDASVVSGLNYIVMEYVQCDFLNFCTTMGEQGEEAGRMFFNQIIDVVEQIHQQGVAHRDIKLENFAIDSDLNLKLLDFGLSSEGDIQKLFNSVGSPRYMAPEVHECPVHSGVDADLFAIGVVLFQIVTGICPFITSEHHDTFYSHIVQGSTDVFWRMHFFEHLSTSFKDLVVSLIAHNPSERPSIEELRNHPWLKERKVMFELQSDQKSKKYENQKNRTVKFTNKSYESKRNPKTVDVEISVPVTVTDLSETRIKLK